MSIRSVQNMTLDGAGVNRSFSPTSDLVGDFEAIATVTVGSGGASSIIFSSIPSTYKHLQIRGIGRTQRALAAAAEVSLQLNSSGQGYARHILYGNGSAVSADGLSSFPYVRWIATFPDNNNAAGTFGAFVIDILDYASTAKNTTIRSLHGLDTNSFGYITITSALWDNTAAITSISIDDFTGNGHAQYTTAALYGVRA